MDTFTKTDSSAALRLEAAGLRWLGEAMLHGGAHTVGVIDLTSYHLVTNRITPSRITARAAYQFGSALALTHAAGAPYFGAPPRGWDSCKGNMGRAPLSFVSEDDAERSWGAFYAQERLLPYLEGARNNGSMSLSDIDTVEKVCTRLIANEFDSEQPQLVSSAASRIHGDLWSGNVLWADAPTLTWAPSMAGSSLTASRSCKKSTRPASYENTDPARGICGVLIDPAAQGGHAETDLSYLGLFHQPHLNDIYAGYDSVSPLAPGWKERVSLHQLHILIVHAYLFGGGYGAQTAQVARRYA
ncbi:MAG: fructosamine kinase family protein [Actinomycetaceae bacterium]|nr:fructosamine kinase family protein [Actinomycetaceae bacterium]